MANDLNRCQFIGRLGKDPEIKYTPNGTAVASISLACGWKTKEKEGVEWIKCVAWGRLAEVCGEYLNKGSLVYIEGRLQTRDWEDKDGIKRYITEIIASSMQMLGNRKKGDTATEPERQAKQAPQIPDEDVPF